MLNLTLEILDTLPSTSRLKLERLAADRAAAQAAYYAASDAAQQLMAEVGRLKGFAQQQKEAHQGFATTFQGMRHTEDKTSANERYDAPVRDAEHRLQMARDALERAALRQGSYAFLDEVEAWLLRTATPGGSFKEWKIDPNAMKIKGDIASEITKVRNRIELVEKAFVEVEAAPAPAADLKTRAFAEIEKISKAAASKVSFSFSSRDHDPLRLNSILAVTTAPGIGGSVNIIGDAGASFFVWLMEDTIKDKISSIIDGLPQIGVMSDDERERAFADLSAQRLELEYIEEQLIATAEAGGRFIERRRDADPRAILCIEA